MPDPPLTRAARLFIEPPLTPARLGRRLRGGSLRRAVEGRVAVVTGASSGIGAATAVRLGAAGARVVLVARSAEALDETAAEIRRAGGTAHVVPCDLSDLDAVDALAASVLAEHGRVDVLVNNAGRSIHRSVLDATDRMHDYQRTMQLNYFGTVKLVLALIPSMVDRGSGRIVNVSTWGTQTTAPRFSAYVASKAAVDAFSRSVGADLEGTGVTVSAVNMPMVRTPMVVPNRLYDHLPALSPEGAAALLCEAIVSGAPRVSTRIGTVAAATDALTTWPIQQTNRVVARLQSRPSARRGKDD